MQVKYLSLPLRLDQLILKRKDQVDEELSDGQGFNREAQDEKDKKYRKDLDECSLYQSIWQHLNLLLTTSFGEFPADVSFGCDIWDFDFDNITSAHKVKEAIRLSLLQSIIQKEKRLGNVRVELTIVQEELSGTASMRNIKKKIDILIRGTLMAVNEKKEFRFVFFVGPLSY
jgi:hypothetical protein